MKCSLSLSRQRRASEGSCQARVAGDSGYTAEPPLSAEKQKSVRSKKEGLSHGQILKILATLRKTVPEEAVLTGFHATRPLTEKMEGPVLPFLGDLIRECGPGLSCNVHTGRLRCTQSGWNPVALRASGPPTSSKGVGEGVQGFHPQRLEPGRDRQHQQAWSGVQNEGAHQVYICNPTRACLPTYKLINPHNVCYLNSSVIAIAWAGLITDKSAAYGALNAALSAVNSARGAYAPRLISWMPVLQNWENLHQQQDAGELLTFLLRRANPPACAGLWMARRLEQDRAQVQDSGTLTAPLPMPLQGETLQACIDAWERQSSIHAIVRSVG